MAGAAARAVPVAEVYQRCVVAGSANDTVIDFEVVYTVARPRRPRRPRRTSRSMVPSHSYELAKHVAFELTKF